MGSSPYRSAAYPEASSLSEAELHDGHPIPAFLFDAGTNAWRNGYDTAVSRCQLVRGVGPMSGLEIYAGECGHVWRSVSPGAPVPCPVCSLMAELAQHSRPLDAVDPAEAPGTPEYAALHGHTVHEFTFAGFNAFGIPWALCSCGVFQSA